ncbi:hypothetical protein SPSIL_033360 [Sporomusa silvacetica DSM 10669]|uniref:LIM zinc-binding domain-containing protein n=1 Tax=Sporomusa silvacetica DSM 10669 TaxID=1123289 RepID=A0ABZ3IN97_9FIRM|nr:hypothetical protein [Sporomusa silvacetica]OZC15082.1 hypothetical protein SPSIL_43270 [Sporomusa silvacetica DSM 10669]
MICTKCNSEIPEGEQCLHHGKMLCEDCYLEVLEPPRTCDVAAVYGAKLARKMAGQEGSDGLTELQKNIYNYINETGSVTAEQIMNKFNLSKLQLERNFAVLRHCELAHGFIENGKKMIKVWGEDTLGKMNIAD